MARAVVYPGNCGFTTTIVTQTDGDEVTISIVSDCKAIQKLAQEITRVNPYQEISFRRSTPTILQAGAKYCTHAACPVPVGIIKAVELEAGLALPAEVTIKLSSGGE